MEDKRIGSRLRDLIEYIGENPDRQSLDESIPGLEFYEYEPRYLEVMCKSMRGVKNEGKMSFNKYV